MEKQSTVIEINGAKFEVDMRHAKRVDTLRIGDTVKVLVKVYDGYKVHAGTVIGFEPFTALPTIVVAYLDIDYTTANIKFVHFNGQSKDVEIVKSVDDDLLEVNRDTVLRQMDREIEKARASVSDLEAKREFFLRNFKSYWPQSEPIEA